MILRALLPDDGWGIVEDGGTLFWVRPPYDRPPTKAPADTAERAIRLHGYERCRCEFTDLPAVIAHLRESITTGLGRRGVTAASLRERLMAADLPDLQPTPPPE